MKRSGIIKGKEERRGKGFELRITTTILVRGFVVRRRGDIRTKRMGWGCVVTFLEYVPRTRRVVWSVVF